jgi:hypothetical protein
VGDVVTLTVGATTATGTVDASGNYSISVAGSALAANTAVTASLAAHDAANELSTVSTTQSYTVDTTPTITVTVGVGNDVTWSEQSGQVPVTGHVSGTFTTGDVVTLTVGTQSLGTATVAADGSYSINVAASALTGSTQVTASLAAHDAAGQLSTVSATQSYTVDVTPTITVSAPDITTANENGTVSITGTTTGAMSGNTVTVTLADNVTYSGTVNPDGTYTIANVQASDLIANTAHSLTATVTATDAAGQSLSVTSAPATYQVDVTPTTSISVTVADNNDVTWSEQKSGDDDHKTLTVKGQVTGSFSDKDVVTLTVGSNTYTTTVDSKGNYSLKVDESVLATNTSVTASVAAHDASGALQTVQTTQSYTVDVTPTISISLPFGNDLTWSDQSSQSITVTGHVTGTFTAGDAVTLKVGGTQYSGTVDASGNYSIDVAESALAGHKSITASLTATDSAQTHVTVSTTQDYTVDKTTTLKVDDVNFGEDNSGTATVKGHVHGTYTSGDVVTVTVGSTQVTGSVNSDGNFTVSLDKSLLSGVSVVSASIVAHDASGEALTVSGSKTISNDSGSNNSQSGEGDGSSHSTPPSIAMDQVGASGVITIAQESANGNVTITGTVSGTFQKNDPVTLTVGNVTVGTGAVDSSGHYSISVPVSALEGATAIGASVAASDGHGNSTTATTSQSYTVESMPQITVSLPVGNEVTWSEQSGQVAVTGHASGTYTAGDTVTLSVGGQSVGTGTVAADGSYSISVAGSALAAGTAVTASLAAHDAAGQLSTVSATQAYSVDTTPTITVNLPVSNEVTWSEQSGQVAVTGHVSGTYTAGDTVTLAVGDTTATGTVDASGNYSISVAGSALAANTAVTASLAAHDAANEVSTVSATQHYTADVTPTITVTVPINNDVTWSEQSGPVAVTGHVGGTYTVGDMVTLAVGGTTATGAVDASGNYSINVAGSALAANTAVTASLAAHDAANEVSTVSATQSYTADVTPTITVAVGANNDVTVGDQKADKEIAVTGVVSGTYETGDQVTLTVGQNTFTGSVDSSGHFSITVSADVLATANSVGASVTAHDAANQAVTATTSQTYLVDSPGHHDAKMLHMNDVVAPNTGDLLQNLPTSNISVSTGTTAPATDTLGGAGTTMIDAEALKALVASVTPPPSTVTHH